MKIIPLNDRVLVKSTEAEEKTASGIYIPQTSQEKTQIAEVIAVGDSEDIKDPPRQVCRNGCQG